MHAVFAYQIQVEIIICLIFLFTIINTSYNWNNHKVVFYQNRRNSSVIVKAASDPSPGQEPPNNNENKDNSLLSNNNIVKGKRIPYLSGGYVNKAIRNGVRGYIATFTRRS